MSVSFMIFVSVGYIALLFLATMYNHFKGRNELFKSSVFVLFIYAVAHLGNTLWLTHLPLQEQIAIHYLYYAAAAGILAVGLFFINRHKMRMIMALTIGLLAIEVLLGYLVHIDRNVVALNGAVTPNTSGSLVWLLWDIRNYLSIFSTFTVILALSLSDIYQVTTEDPTEAYDEAEDVEAYLEKFKPSERVAKAKAFANLAAENLCFHDGIEKNQHKAMAGTMLLNEAIKQCCYEPGKTAPVGFFGRFVYWLRS